MSNDLALVRDVTDRMLSAQLEVWLAGGWAEELRAMISPRSHHDIDLLLRAGSFDEFEAWLSRTDLAEIESKRFPHKRALEISDTMVEIILVNADLTTHFWGTHAYTWPGDTFDDDTGRPPLVSNGALRHYRTHRPAPRPVEER